MMGCSGLGPKGLNVGTSLLPSTEPAVVILANLLSYQLL